MKESLRHSRAGCNPVSLNKRHYVLLDSRLRGDNRDYASVVCSHSRMASSSINDGNRELPEKYLLMCIDWIE